MQVTDSRSTVVTKVLLTLLSTTKVIFSFKSQERVWPCVPETSLFLTILLSSALHYKSEQAHSILGSPF